jgi:hypothetical protein
MGSLKTTCYNFSLILFEASVSEAFAILNIKMSNFPILAICVKYNNTLGAPIYKEIILLRRKKGPPVLYPYLYMYSICSLLNIVLKFYI